MDPDALDNSHCRVHRGRCCLDRQESPLTFRPEPASVLAMDNDDLEVCQDGPHGCDGAVTFDSDPFAHEIAGDDTPVWMCEEHRCQSAMDI